MPKFFELSEEQRRLVFTQTANKIGIPVQAVDQQSRQKLEVWLHQPFLRLILI